MRRIEFRFLILVILLLPAAIFCGRKSELSNQLITIESPDGAIQVFFEIRDGSPFYRVQRKGKALLKNSRLGFLLKDLPSLDKDFEVIKATATSSDDTWTQPWGEVSSIRNNYHCNTIELQERSGLKRKLTIVFKVYNDGIGFRYEIPSQPELKDFVISDELTEFSLVDEFEAWWIPAYGKEMDSEYLFHKNKLNELQEKMNTPLTLEGDGVYISFHEAALIDYASMALFNKGNNTLKCDLIPWSNGDKVETVAPMKTPWRTIQIAERPGDLVTSYLILNLNEPNALGDVSWIHPGKYNGIWWGMHLKKQTWEGGPKHGATTKNMKQLIDFASKHHLSAVLAEGWNQGWEGDWAVHGNFSFTKPYPDYDIEAISRYAKEKNIGLIAHHETGGNIANYERQLDSAFRFLQQHDIHRLKTGYVNKAPKEKHQSQFMVRHYQKVLEMAARYHVMLDVHEPIKDTGLRRTYPNMMTREGARGTEYEAWSDGNPPSHTTILPFTRCLGGPMDYTPGIFDIQFKTNGPFRVHTTLAKQLALYVVIYSPMQMAADLPENYNGKPAFKFIEDVPTDWNETRVLDAKIGEYVTTVRKDRKSEDWFLGSITNEEARTMVVSLGFLTPGKRYAAELYVDGKGADVNTNPLAIEIKRQEVSSSDSLTLNLAPGGGAAIRFHER